VVVAPITSHYRASKRKLDVELPSGARKFSVVESPQGLVGCCGFEDCADASLAHLEFARSIDDHASWHCPHFSELLGQYHAFMLCPTASLQVGSKHESRGERDQHRCHGRFWPARKNGELASSQSLHAQTQTAHRN
jgi:hypothetical protein